MRLDKMLARERALLSLPKPSPRNHRSVLGYLWDEKPIVQDEADYIHQVDDFVILTNNQDSLFEAFLEEWISSIPLDCVRVSMSDKSDSVLTNLYRRTSFRPRLTEQGPPTRGSSYTPIHALIIWLDRSRALSPLDSLYYLYIYFSHGRRPITRSS